MHWLKRRGLCCVWVSFCCTTTTVHTYAMPLVRAWWYHIHTNRLSKSELLTFAYVEWTSSASCICVNIRDGKALLRSWGERRVNIPWLCWLRWQRSSRAIVVSSGRVRGDTYRFVGLCCVLCVTASNKTKRNKLNYIYLDKRCTGFLYSYFAKSWFLCDCVPYIPSYV